LDALDQPLQTRPGAWRGLLAEQIRTAGPDHPDTLATRGKLANHRQIAGDAAGAIRDYEALLAEQVRTLGPDDHAALATRENLAGMRGIAGDPAGARRDYEALLAHRLRLGRVEVKSTSPDGRYVGSVDPFEARAFTWVDTPELFDTATGRALLALTDRYWHLDTVDWQSDGVVVMQWRHYPIGHAVVSVDCHRLTAGIDSAAQQPLGQLGDQLRRYLDASHP
jgi:hypothetical protein